MEQNRRCVITHTKQCGKNELCVVIDLMTRKLFKAKNCSPLGLRFKRVSDKQEPVNMRNIPIYIFGLKKKKKNFFWFLILFERFRNVNCNVNCRLSK